MNALKQIGPRSYYLEGPVKVGLVKLSETEVCLIDSGNDKEAGRKIRQLLDANGWRLTAIYNTHSNADHIGGNQYLQRQTGCKIYAPGVECDFTRHPVLEPSFLYGGYPCRELRHKFLMAQQSEAEELTEASLPEGFSLLRLPGHFFDMVGFRTPDNVLFLADCLSSRETLDKYQISFLYDPAAYIETLEMVKSLSAEWFVPAHAEVSREISQLAQYNLDKVHEIAQRILLVCRRPLCFESILQQLFQVYGLTMTLEQYALVGSTVRSYLSWLKDTGRVTAKIENHMLLWETLPQG